jgi:dual specificity MAP kinase phosphatase
VRLIRLVQKGLNIVVWRSRHHGFSVTFVWAWTRLYLWTVGRPVLRYCRVTPQLYVGGQMNARGWDWLAARGLMADVNMRTEFDDAAHGIAPDSYLWLPTPDDHAPALDQLRTGADFIHQEIERGGKVYVHCASGVGRAPTMAAAYLVGTGLSTHQAWALIRQARPFIKPTPPQLAVLEEFAADKA